MAAPLPILVSHPNGCLTLSKTRAHFGIRSTSKNIWNEIIQYLRSWFTERLAETISLPQDAFRKREPVHLHSTDKIDSPVTIRQPQVTSAFGQPHPSPERSAPAGRRGPDSSRPHQDRSGRIPGDTRTWHVCGLLLEFLRADDQLQDRKRPPRSPQTVCFCDAYREAWHRGIKTQPGPPFEA
jgi:hypothetical protein